MTKKLSLLFLICILSALNINADVYEGTCGPDVRYSLDTSTGVLKISGTGAMNDFDQDISFVPWGNMKLDIKVVEIADGVTSIGHPAFSGCSGLTSVTIPNSVTSIGSSAFSGCSSLTTIEIPNGVKSIGHSAFSNCSSLTSVTIPSSVVSIGENAFYNCIFEKNGFINNSSLGAERFDYWGAIIVDDRSLGYVSKDGVLIKYFGNKDTFIIPNDITSIGQYAFKDCPNLTSVIIPNSVTSIGYGAFYSCSGLASIEISNNVKSIENYTFLGCSGLTSIEIPNSVTEIGNSAFSGCSRLTSVTIGNSVTSIGYSVFYGCSDLTKVTINSNAIVSKSYSSYSSFKDVFGSQVKEYHIGEGVTSIGEYAFYRCTDLTSITIPNSVTSIGGSAFSGCSGLSSIEIPNSVTSIGGSAFSGCSGLSSIEIPNSVTSIGYSAFSGCSGLTSIEIPNSVTEIGSSAFSGCSGLTKVTINSNAIVSKSYSSYSSFKNVFGSQVKEYVIGDNATSIGSSAFSGCSGLTSVTIGNSVTSIGYSAFSDCSGLTSIEIPNSVTSIGSSAFYGCYFAKQNFINNSSLNSESNKYWGANIVTARVDDCIIEDGVLTKYLGKKETIEIPNSVTSIGSSAFSGCSGLTSVTIPNSVTSIGSSAFYGCSSLTSVTIPNSVTSIGSSAFSGCYFAKQNFINNSSLNSESNKYWGANIVTARVDDCIIEDGVLTKYLGKKETIEIPNSVTSIGSSAFYGCSGLTSVTIPNSVTSIGSSAFSGCSGLTSVTIPNSVTSIGSSAFYGCSSLTSVTIGNSVTSIGSFAFSGCNNLKMIYVNKLADVLFTLWNDNSTKDKCYDVTSGIKIPVPFLSNAGTTMTTVSTTILNYDPDFEYSINFYNPEITDGKFVKIKNLKPNTSYQITLYVKNKNGKTYTAPSFSITTKSVRMRISQKTITSSSVDVTIIYDSYVEDLILNTSLTFAGKKVEGNKIKAKGLNPNTEYILSLSMTFEGNITASTTQNLKTDVLSLVTEQPKVASPGNVVVSATSNLDNEEENIGFEWRRTDWTDEFASNKGGAYIYEGHMEGYIRNLYIEKLWIYRPYYESSSGSRYYGEWVGIDPTNTSYFEPTVHTYSEINVAGNTANVKGYVMRGSDNITAQGFKYWSQESLAKSMVQQLTAIPSNAKTINATGNIMTAEITDLNYETEYHYVSFVTTSEGETFYGEEQIFTTDKGPTLRGDVNGDGEVNVGDLVCVSNFMAGDDAVSKDAADVNQDGEVNVGDMVVISNIMSGNDE